MGPYIKVIHSPTTTATARIGEKSPSMPLSNLITAPYNGGLRVTLETAQDVMEAIGLALEKKEKMTQNTFLNYIYILYTIK